MIPFYRLRTRKALIIPPLSFIRIQVRGKKEQVN